MGSFRATLLSVLASMILVLGLYILVKRYQEVLLSESLTETAKAQSALLIDNRVLNGHGADFGDQSAYDLQWFIAGLEPFRNSINANRVWAPRHGVQSGFVSLPAGEVFRFAEPLIADQNCVTCHNALINAPRQDWVIGTVIGTQVLSLVVPDAPQAGSRAFRDIIIFISVFFTVAILVGLISQARVQGALDVVRRREAEGRLLSLVASRTDNAVLITSAEGRTEWVNDGFTRMTGYDLEAVNDRTIGALFLSVQSDEATKKRVNDALNRHEPFSEIVQAETKDGRRIWMAVDCQPIFDETGKLSNFIAIQRDISELKDREQALERARQEAEAANEAKSRFLANMSHEIRTPMNGIIGMTRLLLNTGLGKRQHNYADTIRISGEALLEIINDILDFSKIDAGHVVFVDTVFELREVLQGTINILEPSAQTKDVQLSLKIDDKLNAFVLGDKGRLRQVLLNLVGNAVKFTDAGFITLLAREGLNKGTIRFEITDTGIGIAAEDLEGIFQSFSQIDASSSRRFEGTGLGLAISRQLVEGMGGQIGVESEVGRGSSFWFELPLPVAEPQQNPLPDAIDVWPVKADHKQEDLVFKKLQILVAEDNVINQQVAEGFLNSLGHSIDIAVNGVEAVEAVKAKDYDLVFMDVQMPLMDGLEATEHIRRLPKPKGSVPIIAMTANAMQADATLCLERGMNDHLSKPVLMNQLQQIIRRWHHGLNVDGTNSAEAQPVKPSDTTLDVDLAILKRLKEQLGAEMLQEILSVFSTDTDNRIARLAEAAEDQTTDMIAKQSHSIKGSAASLGLYRVTRAAEALEASALAGDISTIEEQQIELLAAKQAFDDWFKNQT